MVLLSKLFENRSIFGWVLSNSGSDGEERLAKLSEVIDDPSFFASKSMELPVPKRELSCIAEHRLGLDLLAPRRERLHFENTGLTTRPVADRRLSQMGHGVTERRKPFPEANQRRYEDE